LVVNVERINKIIESQTKEVFNLCVNSNFKV
jgi:hypothetical protein